MATIEMQGSNWIAYVAVSDIPDGLYHVTVKTRGGTKADVLLGAQFVLKAFTEGRTTYIRVNPEAHSDTDFDTKETRHIGFARFSFAFEDGQHHAVADETIVTGFSDLLCKEAV